LWQNPGDEAWHTLQHDSAVLVLSGVWFNCLRLSSILMLWQVKAKRMQYYEGEAFDTNLQKLDDPKHSLLFLVVS